MPHRSYTPRSEREQRPQPIKQGDILPNGALVAVLISPEDIRTAYCSRYGLSDAEDAMSITTAASLLSEHAEEISSALVAEWVTAVETALSDVFTTLAPRPARTMTQTAHGWTTAPGTTDQERKANQ